MKTKTPKTHVPIKKSNAPKKRPAVFFWFILILIGLVAVRLVWRDKKPLTNDSEQQSQVEASSLDDLLKMSPDALAKVDIAKMNLLCAQGLRGAEPLDVAASLQTLDAYTERVRSETERYLFRYYEHPEQYEHSEAYFRLMVMTTVLQRDLGIRYNPDRAKAVADSEANDVFYTDSSDVFLHGLTSTRAMGTCASLPVLYVAVGRKLGYPMHLVSTKSHLFVRWQRGREKWNMDATSQGLVTFPDVHYKTWPFPVSDAEIQASRYLQNMTASEELASFLSIRSMCLMSMGQLDAAIATSQQAARIAPQIRAYQIIAEMTREDAANRRHPVIYPPDPILQITGDEADWAARRAELMGRQRKGEGIGPPDPNPFLPVPIYTKPVTYPIKHR